jgi:glycogen debranching enzyme
VLARQLDPARANDRLGRAEPRDRLDRRAQAIETAIANRAGDPNTGFFYDVDARGDRLPAKTVAGFAPLVLDGIHADRLDRLVHEHLSNENEFWTAASLASVARDENTQGPEATWPLWRGLTWVNTNYLTWRGLHNQGYTEPARELASRTREMVREAGFAEFYHPETGERLRERSHGFAWSTLATLMTTEAGPGERP